MSEIITAVAYGAAVPAAFVAVCSLLGSVIERIAFFEDLFDGRQS